MTLAPSGAAEALPWAGEAYSVKRHGVTITSCDSEPVQTPGCIQDHGALLVLRLSDLTILQASENVERWLGRPVRTLLGQPVSEAIGAAGRACLVETLAAKQTECNPVHVLTIAARASDTPPFDVSVHTVDGVAVVEIEATDRSPAREAPDYYSLLKNSVAGLQATRTLLGFCQVVTDEFRSLTGFDRVMVYRFHEDDHGEVFAESRRSDLTAWLGLHYPAEDIPKPAREIFKQIWIRPVPDVGAELSELVPLTNPDTGKALTMTHCALRGPSVMYTEYLQNMQVKAALTLSIRRDGELWGLIACHHYSSALAVPYHVRAAAEFFAQVVSLQLRSADEREQLLYKLRLDGVRQHLITSAARAGGLSAMADGTLTLFDALDSGGAAIYHQRVWSCMGNTPSEDQLHALGEWLYRRPDFARSAIYATDCLVHDYPAAAAFANVASGLLALPISFSRKSFLLWFRPETVRALQWGGNPHEKPTVPGPHGPRLTPRRSFELFVESVHQRALPWKPVEIEAAGRLRLFLMELVVDQSERLADLNADLARSNEDLDAFAYVASHDLKEPLRGIHKYAHQLLEDATFASAEQQTKLNSLMRLTLRMDSLLDSLLHYSRVGRSSLELLQVDLSEILDEAIEMLSARRTERATEIVVARPLAPARCDAMSAREVFVNLISNALKYNDRPHRRIEVGYLGPDERESRGNVPPEAHGQIVYFVRDDGIGIHPKHHAHVFDMFRRLHGREEYGGGTGAGLTIVKKLVERHRGQIWLESSVGAGSTFFFTLEGREP